MMYVLTLHCSSGWSVISIDAEYISKSTDVSVCCEGAVTALLSTCISMECLEQNFPYLYMSRWLEYPNVYNFCAANGTFTRG